MPACQGDPHWATHPSGPGGGRARTQEGVLGGRSSEEAARGTGRRGDNVACCPRTGRPCKNVARGGAKGGLVASGLVATVLGCSEEVQLWWRSEGRTHGQSRRCVEGGPVSRQVALLPQQPWKWAESGTTSCPLGALEIPGDTLSRAGPAWPGGHSSHCAPPAVLQWLPRDTGRTHPRSRDISRERSSLVAPTS